MQQIFLGLGAVATKTYVDDVFSTYLFKGNAGTQAINNGIDLAGEGGLVWTKNRTSAFNNFLYDTERGVQKYLISDSTIDQQNVSTSLTAFNSNGFTLGAGDYGNITNGNQATSWSFRKAPGFFTIKQYTGTGSTQSLTHDLGSIPGMMIVKKTSGTGNWAVYHRAKGANYITYLNLTSAGGNSGSFWWNTEPTSTHFTVGNDADTNASGATYVAYLFAGGESTAATARSVDFDSSQEDALTTAHSSDFDFGSGDFTVEAWIKPTNASQVDPTPVSVWNFPDGRRSWAIFGNTGGAEVAFDGSIRAAVSPDGQFATRTEISGTVNLHQWNHVAFTRSSNTLYFFINGVLQGTASFTGSVYSNTSDGIMIGGMGDSADIRNEFDGSISNVRVVKGTAVYTSSFRPPYEPLTNITNTKLLCCNNSSTTGSTVTPGTITAHNSPTASTDSPFDDPAAHVFGESGLENVIKCGSYVGAGWPNSGLPEVNLGFEPQWVLIKRADGSSNWRLHDSMRGIVTGGNDAELEPNVSSSEATDQDKIDLTSTGFKLATTSTSHNADGETYIFLAIRRSDGYVGKPPELGTGVFAMDTGSSSAVIPQYDSNFPVDFALARQPSTSETWYTCARLTQGKYLSTDSTAAESSSSIFPFDSNVGWAKNHGTNYQSWMWKRHAGFDVVTYGPGTDTTLDVAHSLGKTPEMIWVKRREQSVDWNVYHSALASNKRLRLNLSNSEQGSVAFPNAPTSSHFTVQKVADEGVNDSDGDFIALLFANVDGISKVGSYTGNGTSGHAITGLGFAPRFLIVKAASTTSSWSVFDTTRGWASGNDKQLALNSNAAEVTSYDYADPTSTGFTINITGNAMNGSGETYIYYAHA